MRDNQACDLNGLAAERVTGALLDHPGRLGGLAVSGAAMVGPRGEKSTTERDAGTPHTQFPTETSWWVAGFFPRDIRWRRLFERVRELRDADGGW